MENQLQIFDYEEKEIRTVEIDNEPWFVLKDVCEILELGSPHKVAERLDTDERNQIPLTDALGRQQQTSIINESGLYNVIFRSDKSEAQAFRRFVTHEILPSIRKTGKYVAKSTPATDKLAIQTTQINIATIEKTLDIIAKYNNGIIPPDTIIKCLEWLSTTNFLLNSVKPEDAEKFYSTNEITDTMSKGYATTRFEIDDDHPTILWTAAGRNRILDIISSYGHI